MIAELISTPQIIQTCIVATCSVVVTALVNRATKMLNNVATKEFVTTALGAHGIQLKSEIGDMFVKASSQALVNADVEARVRRVEAAFGVKLQQIVNANELLPPNKAE